MCVATIISRCSNLASNMRPFEGILFVAIAVR